MSKVTTEELEKFFAEMFPGRTDELPSFDVIEKDYIEVTLPVRDYHIRPGGFISGPTQMMLADHAAYVVIFTSTGIMPMAVTSNLNIDFLRPCKGTSVTAKARLIKIGKSLAVIAVDIVGESSDKLSSRATVTYALPQGLKS